MSTNPQPERSPLVDELTAFGQKLGKAFRSAIDSPQRHEIEREVKDGFQNIVTELNEAFTKARSSEVAKDVEEQAEKVVEVVKSGKVTQDLRDGLVKGLQALNQELDELVDRLQTRGAAPESAAAPEPPVTAEPPAAPEAPAAPEPPTAA